MAILIAIIAMISPIVGFGLTLIYFNQYRKAVISALLCGIVFSAAIYGYIPDIGNDIFRHMSNLSAYEGISLWDSFDILKTSTSHISGVYTWDVWMWTMAQFGNSYLLQSSGAFVGYSLISYMVFSQAKHNNLLMKEWLPFYGMAILSFPILEVAIGIRSANAFIICALTCYLYYYQNRNQVLVCLLLFISLFLHHGAIVPISVLLFLPLFNLYPKTIIFFLAFVFLGLYKYQGAILLLMGSDYSSGGIVSNSLYTASVYSQSDFNDSFHAVVTLMWRFGLSIILTYIVKKENLRLRCSDRKSINDKIINFSVLISIISFGLVFIIGNNGLRYLGIANLLCCICLEAESSSQREREQKLPTVSKISLLVGNLGCCALYLYDMAWGSASIKSLALSAITGYLSRSL